MQHRASDRRPPRGNRSDSARIDGLLPLTIGALYLYRNIRAEMTPGEGDLIVNVNTATQDELETVPGIGPYTVKSIAPYVKVTGETENR